VKLNEAFVEMDMPFHSAEQLINSQINEILGKVRRIQKEQEITLPSQA
jgi:hypothetical protein